MTVVERGVGGEMSQLWNKFSSAQRSDELPRNPSIHLNKSSLGMRLVIDGNVQSISNANYAVMYFHEIDNGME